MPNLLLLLTLGGCKAPTFAPIPTVTEPALTLNTRGYFHGDTATIEGTSQGLTDITINGEPAFLNGDAYQATIPLERGVNMVEVIGTDGNADPLILRQGILSGTYGPPDDRIGEALTIRLNRGGIDKAVEVGEEFLAAQDFEPLLLGYNPVYEGSYDVLGFEAGSISAVIEDIDYFRPVLGAEPKTGELFVTASIPYFRTDIRVTGHAIGFDFDETIDARADSIDVTIDLQASVDNGELQLTATNPSLTLQGFDFDVSILPDAIEGLLTDRVQTLLEDKVVEILEPMLPELLADRFKDLEIAFETELLGKSVGIEGFLVDASIDDFGMELHTDLRVDVQRGIDTGEAGYLSVPETSAAPSLTDDIGVTLSDNVLNNVLFQAWRAGLLQMDLDSTRGDIDASLLTPLGAQGSARIFIDAKVPPVMIERNGSAMLQATELVVRVETPGGDNGEYIVIGVSAFVDLDLVVEDGVLKLSLNEPEVLVDVRESDWGLSDNTLTNLLAEQLPVDTLLAVLGDIEIPLPSIAGLSLEQAVATRDATGAHTAVGANL